MSKARDTAAWGQFQPVRKNIIINGGMTISQRAALFPSVTSADYTLDRWQIGLVGAMALQVSQQTDTTAPELTSSYLFVEVTTADASVGSTDFTIIQQPIEGYNTIPLGWQLADQSKKNYVTVSFWHSHTKTGTHCVALRNAGNTRSYVHEFTQAVADTWEYTSFTVPAPTDGTWVVENTTSLKLVFIAMAGTAYHTTADAWQAGNYFATSNQVNNMDSTSNRMRITGVQLEVGTEATDFEYRLFGEELAMCQRYYESSYDWQNNIFPGTISASSGGSYLDVNTAATILYGLDPAFSVTKRAAPTMTFYSFITGASGNIGNVSLGSDVAISSVSNVGLRQVPTVIATGVQTVGEKLYAMWEADAEI